MFLPELHRPVVYMHNPKPQLSLVVGRELAELAGLWSMKTKQSRRAQHQNSREDVEMSVSHNTPILQVPRCKRGFVCGCVIMM